MRSFDADCRTALILSAKSAMGRRFDIDALRTAALEGFSNFMLF